MKKYTLLLLATISAMLLSGCFNLSPTYAPPTLNQPTPDAFKNIGDWKQANPNETLNRGSWWTMFQDTNLNNLMTRLNASNQKIAVAAANYRQARAQVSAARASFFPTVSLPGSVTRSGSGDSPAQTGYSGGIATKWELNLWNTIPAFEAASAQSEGSAADYAAIKLAMQAELAQTYFQLRSLDGQITLYESTIAAYAKGVQLTRSQYQGGLVTPADVAQAEAQLASAEAQLADLQRQRSILESAIAVLTGTIPSSFSLERGPLIATLPKVPTAVPSTLLERRPDIASAERQVAVANEQIGLARAAWFPTLSLGGSRTMQAAGIMAAPLTIWSFGPSAALSIFEGGKHLAEGDAAQARFEATAANYRQTVLEGFKEVEDNLSALQFLSTQAEAQARAVSASQMALRLSLSQYRGGMTTYLQVVNTQTSSLTNERSAIQIQGQRLIAAVNLIKALGGGWDAESLQLLHTNIPQEGAMD